MSDLSFLYYRFWQKALCEVGKGGSAIHTNRDTMSYISDHLLAEDVSPLAMIGYSK